MDTAETVTFEKVWAALMENREQLKESDRQWQETREQMKEEMNETKRIISKLGNRFGDMIEHMVVPNITKKFKELNYTFEQVSKDHKISDASGNCIVEVDILLENGDTVKINIPEGFKPREW